MITYDETIMDNLYGDTPRQKHLYLELLTMYAKLGKYIYENAVDIELNDNDINKYATINKLFKIVNNATSNNHKVPNELMSKVFYDEI